MSSQQNIAQLDSESKSKPVKVDDANKGPSCLTVKEMAKISGFPEHYLELASHRYPRIPEPDFA